jgi:hypothetical protein
MRKYRSRGLVAIAFSLTLGGCAGVTFYSDPALTQRTGLKYYIAKPYLLVTRDAAKDAPLKVDVIQLPDLEHPNYGVYKPGWGTHEFALKVTNGILTEYNQKADSKGPETIGAVADLMSKAGSGFSSAATAFQTLQKQAADVPAAVGAINLAIGELHSAASVLPAGTNEANTLSTSADNLRKVAADITTGKTDQKARLQEIKSALTSVMANPALPEGAKITKLLTSAQGHIDEAITALSAVTVVKTESPHPTYELYEIRMENAETVLVPVKISRSLLRIIEHRTGLDGK